MKYGGQHHHLEAIPVGVATHSGRPTYCVVCHTCRALVWHETTAPLQRMQTHIEHPELELTSDQEAYACAALWPEGRGPLP